MRFGTKLLGKNVCVVFGNGVNALLGEVTLIDDDYIVVKETKQFFRDFHIPVVSIVYVRIDP